MKYKVLKSIAHNFSHSFLSGMNFVDNVYIVDELRKLARNAGGERISIQWIPDSLPERAYPRRVTKSIALYKKWLPQHIESAGGSLECIREFRTDIFIERNQQLAAEARLIDDRGKQHICRVLF